MVYISKDGALLGRSFEAVSLPKDIKKVSIGNSFNKPEAFIDKKIDEVIHLRNKRHRNMKDKSLRSVLLGKTGKTTIAHLSVRAIPERW